MYYGNIDFILIQAFIPIVVQDTNLPTRFVTALRQAQAPLWFLG